MRVDHLEPGELDYELLLRNVVVGDDESRVKRRRRLRQIMKEENDGHEFIIHYDLDPEMDLNACKLIFSQLLRKLSSEPRTQVEDCRSRLLHLGHRLAIIKNHAVGELKSRSSEEFAKVLNLFSEYFWSEQEFFMTGGEAGSESDVLLDEAAGGENVPAPASATVTTATGTIPKKPDSSQFVSKTDFNQAMTDIGSLIKALASQVSGLKEEMRKQRPPPPVPPRPSSAQLNSSNPFRSDDVRPNQSGPASSQSQRPVDGRQSRWTTIPTSSTSGGISYPPPVSQGGNGNESFIRRIDEFTFSPFAVGNHNQSPNPQNNLPPRQPVGPTASFVPAVAPLRKMTPVSQWKVRKYSGNDHGLGLNEFLSHIEQLALSEHATELDLFDSAVHLFEGAALSWYTSCRNQRLLQNWPQLVQELQNEFRHPDLDSVLRTKIYQTRQQKGESFQQYYLQVNKLFQAMSHPLADSEKLEVLKTNLRYDCRKALVGKNVTTLRELLTIGKDLDATDFSAFTKVFGPPKRETCAIDYNSRNATGSKTFVNQNRQRSSPALPKNSKPESNNSKPDSKPGPTSKRNPFEKAGKSEGSPPDPKPGPSKPSALLKLISNYSPPEEGQCFNCREYHNLSECPIPRRVFCNRCALIGFTTNNCPYCLKNGLGKP